MILRMKKRSTKVLLGFLVLGLMAAAWFAGAALRSGPGPSSAVDPTGKTIQITGGSLPPGCRCHSNKPAVIFEHKKYGITDCAKCHPKKLPQEKPQEDLPFVNKK